MPPFMPTKNKEAREVFGRKTSAARESTKMREAREAKKSYKAPKLTMSRGKDGNLS